MKKTVFGVSDQVRHKPGCTATEDGLRLSQPIAQLGERRTLDRKGAGSIFIRALCCVLEQDTSSPLLSTG